MQTEGGASCRQEGSPHGSFGIGTLRGPRHAGVVAYAIIDFLWTPARGALRGSFLSSGSRGDPGLRDFGRRSTFAFQQVVDSFALILAVAMLAAMVVFFALECLQTGTVASLTSQFTTRTLILMPVGIALNIILGATVATALKIPIYLDSIGTILVGVLAARWPAPRPASSATSCGPT